jgi:outer membrane protein assembly factor BamD (BamD/ComL family)
MVVILGHQESVEDLYERALSHARANRFEDAREDFKALTSLFPHACKVWVSWAQVSYVLLTTRKQILMR